jgi:hypothetical protein
MRRGVGLAWLTFVGLSSVASATMLREKWQQATPITNSLSTAWRIINSGDLPTESVVVEDSAFIGLGSHYVVRLSGWITVPETGVYHFYVSTDDFGGLYLSPDDEMAHAVLIASVPGYTDATQWTLYPEQGSAPIALEKGEVRAIYLVMEQNEGGDNGRIGWTGPGIGDVTLITNCGCVTATAPAPTMARGPQPALGATDVARDVILGWRPSPLAASRDVYLGTRFEDVNTADRASPHAVLVSQGQDPNTYSPPSPLSFGVTYYWRVDEVAALDGTIHRGKVWSFTAETFGRQVIPMKATASSSSTSQSGPEKTIDGSGLDALDQHSTTVSDMWVSKKGVTPIWIQYQLDKAYRLYEMWVWNSNQTVEPDVGFGAMDVTVETSLDGTAWTALEGVPQFNQATGEPNYVHNTTIEFGGTQAKYVKLTVSRNWAEGTKQASLSEVRFTCLPLEAYGPSPADGATGVAPDAVLDWRPGREAVTHRIYLSSDRSAVVQATAPVKTLTQHSLALGSLGLEYGRTYYWKVNEVNDAAAVKTPEGELWSFTVADYLLVDGFETYDDACARIFFTWMDGLGHSGSSDCSVAPSAGNATGSTVGNAKPPFAEHTLVHTGRQSMPLGYDNTSKGPSEATRTFDSARDWTQNGLKTLTVYVHGASGNTTGQVYAKVNGIPVPYSGSAASLLTTPLWKQWNIDLPSAAGLQAVQSLSLGVSGSGKGILYVDDIRLYRQAPAMVSAVDPGAGSLVAYYAMEGDLSDGSGHGTNAAAGGTLTYVDSMAGLGKAARFDGSTTYVGLPIGTLIGTLSSFTFTAWLDFDDNGAFGGEQVFDFGTGPANCMFLATRQAMTGPMTFAIVTPASGQTRIPAPSALRHGWHHAAAVIDGPAMAVTLYLDGQPVATGATAALPKDLGTTTNNWLGRSHSSADGYFGGSMDEVRLHNRALTAGEIRYTAGER